MSILWSAFAVILNMFLILYWAKKQELHFLLVYRTGKFLTRHRGRKKLYVDGYVCQTKVTIKCCEGTKAMKCVRKRYENAWSDDNKV